jgi:hypothetical protein
MGLNRGTFAALVAVTLAGVLLAGCGSSGTATTTVKTVVERVATAPRTTSSSAASESAEADESGSEPVTTAAAKTSRHVGSYVGQRLDVAESDAEEAGISVKVLGGGTFGVVVPSHWTVCEQEPSSGTTTNRVKLIVAREC